MSNKELYDRRIRRWSAINTGVVIFCYSALVVCIGIAFWVSFKLAFKIAVIVAVVEFICKHLYTDIKKSKDFIVDHSDTDS